ncbi:MAG: tRNA (adenosine(37)-N6)-dimethylallyltransferase MiaA [Bacteroidales bacterium]|nr:tRNA (adenosine(37)-N6)-dimethylallyltransferase MiaA [Bacteroidales bacterium]
MKEERLLVVLGPTASGKTRMAVRLAAQTDGEIISADSRQVYRGMDIGTGKDLADYEFEGQKIPHHLIDIVAAGERYNVYRYLHDFFEAYGAIKARGKTPILCGGSGMYIEAVCRGFDMPQVPENSALRKKYEALSQPDLIAILQSYGPLHNTTDTQNRKRLIRAIEIAQYRKGGAPPAPTAHGGGAHGWGGARTAPTVIIGIDLPVEQRRARIDRRLEDRLQNGMVEEAQRLIKEGLTVEDMIYYGLEYKYLALYLTGVLSYEEMKRQLQIAIHQFAKRQMTWFRGMERRGLKIHWVDALHDDGEILDELEKIVPL